MADDRYQEVVEAIRFAMVTTMDRTGALHSRPMSAQRTDGDGTLWFVAAASAPLVRQLREQPVVLITFGDARLRRWVSIRGAAAIHADAALAEALWDAECAVRFPGGPADPGVVVVKVEVDAAEYWDPVAASEAFPQFMHAVRTGEAPRARRASRSGVFHAPQAREE